MVIGTAANSTMTSSTTLASHPTKESGSPPSIAGSTHSHPHSDDSGAVTKEKPAAAAAVAASGSDKNTPKSAPPKGHSGTMQAPLELPRWRFWLVFVSLMVAIFLFALDQLIIATAIPKITVEFNSLTELSWLASGFFLTLLGFNLMYSQWNQIFPSKHVMMFAVFIFEVGSLLCGVAPSMRVLILGRAVAGVGAAGIFSGGMIVIAEITAIHERAQYFGLFGVCFAIASIIGPLVGGAFADHVSWRWCFYINLPIGGIALVMLFLSLPASAPLGRADSYKGYSKEMFWQVVKCDWLGVVMAMAWGCCTILAMQWGGVTKPWNDGSVIACFVMMGVIPVIFVLYETWLGDKAMFRVALFKRRTIIGACIVAFFLFAVFMFEVYYLSIAYQAAYHTSATGAGVKLLPFILVQIAVLILSSRIIPLIGRFKWVIVAGPVFLAIGSGLLYTVQYGTPESHLYGFQVFLGIGIGLSLQNMMLAVQFELKNEPWLISAGTGLSVFIGFAGRIIGLSLAGSVFENMIQVNLRKYAPSLPTVYISAVINSAGAIWDTIPEQYQQEVLVAYTESLRDVYIIGVPCAILAFFGALIIKNSKMPSKAEEQARIQAMREKAALAKEQKEGVAPAQAEAEAAAEAEVEVEAERVDLEAANAEGLSGVNPLPVQAEVDAQAALAKQEGKSAV